MDVMQVMAKQSTCQLLVYVGTMPHFLRA